MAGNGRFDMTSSSPDSRSVGSRGNVFGPSLERSGSFREGGESRLFGTGPSNNRVSGMMIGNVPSLSQSLMLEQIVMGDQKCSRLGELKKVLGYSARSSSEENTFGAAHSRPASHLDFEELKRYKDSVADSSTKARFRSKKLDEHLHKLNKYVEVANSKKQAKNGLPSNERSTLNLKMGVQVHQSLPEVVPQRLEDRSKNTLTNKRVRTSMAETRAECRSNGVARQALVMAKDCDLLKDNSPSSDLVEEKVRRLPGGGEGWDKKIKRKRGSVGTSLTRPVDGDGELKGSTHHKVITEPGLPSGDAQSFRSGHVNRISGTNKLDGGSLHDQAKANPTGDLPAGLNKSKPLAKGNNGLNVHEENHVASASPLTKSKGSRAPRSSSLASPNSSLSISHLSENGEQPFRVNKSSPVDLANICKRALPGGASSSPMAQWVGQRPQKMSRTRRANLVSPVSNHEEGSVIYEGSSPSDLSSKLNSGGTSGSLLSRGMANGHLQLKAKCEKVSSPAQFSGGEESGACESELKEKVVASDAADEKAISSIQEPGPSLFVTKNNKPLIKEENGNGLRRPGQSERGSFSMATISPSKEKLDSAVTMTPLRTTRPGSEKSGSKAGRPSKKQSDRKGSSRRGTNSSSSDFTGESYNDREELLAAAVSARNASDQACSSSLWKKLKPIFGPARSQDTSYFSQEVNFAEELHGSLSQMLFPHNNGDIGHEETSQNNGIGLGETNRRMQNHIEQNGSATIVDFADQFQEFFKFCGKIDSDKILSKVAPLCQRVLSALILDDELEELEEDYMEGNVSVQNMNALSCDREPGEVDGMVFDCGSGFGTQPGNIIFTCNGTNKPNRGSIFLNHSENGFLHSDVGAFVSHVGNDLGQTIVPRNGFTIYSFDNQYEKMDMEDKLLLELQSIGIHLDTVVHAVVLLYNYYFRKQHPQVEYLGFKSFCQLAVVVKPTLMGHMKLMHHTDLAELDDLENQLSVTEKAIMDACDISSALDPSQSSPSIESWEVSKVAVLLTDSSKENCLLQFSSITQGVWSVIEKNVPGARHDGEEGKHISKRKRFTKKSHGNGVNIDKASLQQLALSAVTEATGINHGDVVVLKSPTVYSLSREKSAVQFYIMQSNISIDEELKHSIKNIIQSLQGPLVKKGNCSWAVTPSVEYFHLLPYAGVIEEWFSREVIPNQDLIVEMEREDVESLQKVGNSSVNEDRDDSKCIIEEHSANMQSHGTDNKFLQHQNNTGTKGGRLQDVNSRNTQKPSSLSVKVYDKDEVDCGKDDGSTKIVANGCSQTHTEFLAQKNDIRSVMVCKSDSLGGSENIGITDCFMVPCFGDGEIGNVDVQSYPKIDNHLNKEVLEHTNDNITVTGSKSDAKNMAIANCCVKAGEIKNAGIKSCPTIDNLFDNILVQKNENASVMVCKSDSLGGSKNMGITDCSIVYHLRSVESGNHDFKSCQIIDNLFDEEVSKDKLKFNEKKNAADSNAHKMNGIYADSSKQITDNGLDQSDLWDSHTDLQPMDTDETAMIDEVCKYGLKYNKKTNTDSNDKRKSGTNVGFSRQISDHGTDLNKSGTNSRPITDNGGGLNQSGTNAEFSRQTNYGTDKSNFSDWPVTQQHTSGINAESSKQVTRNEIEPSGLRDCHTDQQTMDKDDSVIDEVCKYGLKCDEKAKNMDSREKKQSGANVEFSKRRTDKIELSGLRNCHTTQKNKDSDDSLMTQHQNGNKLSNGCTITKVYRHKKRTSSSNCNTISKTDGEKVKVDIDDSKSNLSVPKLEDGKTDKGNETWNITCSNQVGPVIGDRAIVPYQLNVDNQDKLQVTRALEQNVLSQTALTYLLRKKSKLYHQLRLLEDEIAVCDKTIQTILDGGESELTLQVESIVDACYDVSLKGEIETQEWACQRFGTQVSPQLRRKRLLDAVIPSRNLCQELDDICHNNFWTLPTYQLYPVNGGFWASIKMKGTDFEYSEEGDLCVKPSLARESAAGKMIAKLGSVAGQNHKFLAQQ